ncbi:BEN domain-containing protein 5-like isoform X1 [Dermacentor variabilis]|uniref:BEN domain-containing protein 5-like isoform X1 n=2 Tax=Dermacentor variabilis TaxID=34621 RepID=UPI003F5C70EA
MLIMQATVELHAISSHLMILSLGKRKLMKASREPNSPRLHCHVPPASCARKDNNMVDIGRGFAINARAWSHIQGHQKDSLFVKDLLLGIWPKDQLKNRSLQGKQCPRYPDRPAKAPLTPSKVEVMRDCYRQRLRPQGVPEHLLPAALKQLNHFVVEKLVDLERLAKWEKDNHDLQASHD